METIATLKVVRSQEPIKDPDAIKKIILEYWADNFSAMCKAIDEYGDRFFIDLWMFLEKRTYKDIRNQFWYFIGITLQYHKRT